jgi:hypothetical protein
MVQQVKQLFERVGSSQRRISREDSLMMSALRGFCGRARPKYIQHVRALYPNRNQPQGKPQNLSAFVHFAVSNPRHLRDIASYIFHRIQKHLRRNDDVKLPIPVVAMCALIDACDADVATVQLFEDSVKASVLLLWSSEKPQAKIFGCRIVDNFPQFGEF